MDDIVWRLRNWGRARTGSGDRCERMHREAADEIERLRKAGDTLALHMAMEHFPEDCDDECESLAAWRAWEEARRG